MPIRFPLAFALLLAALTPAPTASAHDDLTRTSETTAAASATYQFAIPAGPLDQALAAFTAATGLKTIVPAGVRLDNFSSPGATGAFTPEEALRRILDGTQLAFRLASVNAYAIDIRIPSETVEVTSRLTPYRVETSSSATKTLTPLRDVPQSVTVVPKDLIRDQLMGNMADVVRYVPGITTHQGENNRDQVIIRGNSSSADFFVDGVRDDVQYYRDLYNVDRVEALKGPNALMFGRGGAGGVVNRVIKEATFEPVQELSLQAGQFGNKRVTADLGRALSPSAAFRLNGMLEDSESFRRGVDLQRGAINPTLVFVPGSKTRVTVGYEFLRDVRVADRGITSFRGRPADVAPDTYYGNPDDSHVRAQVNVGSVAIEHQLGQRALVRNRTVVANYDRFYQNFVPGSVATDGAMVALTAYNNATARTNVFNQMDVMMSARTRRLQHTVLVGGELGSQLTDNYRQTGFFNNTAASIPVPFGNPSTTTPVTFRQNATDADNHVRTRVAAVFVQDQIDLTSRVQLLGGVRYDRFGLRFQNHRTGDDLTRPDDLISPRAGVVVKPIVPLSLYGSFSVSYLPSSGDQFSQLTIVTQQAEPEKFTNYEVGVKWDLRPALALTGAVYRLDRTHTRATDPNDVARLVQTGAQRTNGFEIGLNGQLLPAWSIAGGYAWQDAWVTSATTAARAGAVVGQVPRHTFSLWNKYRFHPRVAAGLGLMQRSDMFATIDNTVVLPGYLRADAAVFVTLSSRLLLQLNVENLTDARYFVNADSNTNISPGYRRAARLALTTRF